MIQYRDVSQEELCPALFAAFIRRQNVTKCWRREHGAWVIKDAPFLDDWSAEDVQTLTACLKNTLATGGFVHAAFVDGALKGFVSVESALFGGEHRYMDQHSCVGGIAGHRGRDCAVYGGQELGTCKGRGEAVYFRPLRRGDAGVLPESGLCGRGGM